jgi:hypothetical protein
MSYRTEYQDGVEYRIVDLAGRIVSGEGIEFIDAQKVWSSGYRHTSNVGVLCRVDGQNKSLGIDTGQRAFDGEFLWEFLNQPARLAFLQSSVQPILNLLDQEGIFEHIMEGLA